MRKLEVIHIDENISVVRGVPFAKAFNHNIDNYDERGVVLMMDVNEISDKPPHNRIVKTYSFLLDVSCKYEVEGIYNTLDKNIRHPIFEHFNEKWNVIRPSHPFSIPMSGKKNIVSEEIKGLLVITKQK